ncbi:MAG: peptide MFS transporter [Lentimicrobium sp.]
MGKKNIFGQFPSTFWAANVMELFERWAWYGIYMVLALYLTGSTDTGALGFSQEQKGSLMGTVTFLLYLLPIITGAIADRYGYKKVLTIAFTILATGYFSLAYAKSYWAFYALFLYLAVGAALFKPIVTATVSHTTNEKTSSIGFGIFYMIVNIGAFLGPIFSSKLRALDWKYIFFLSSLVICINFILLIFFYKEPIVEKKHNPLIASIKNILKNTIEVLGDFNLILFLLIMVGFWAMYLQLFYTLPIFIDQWMDTRILYRAIENFWPALAHLAGTPHGTIAPEILTNIDAFYIIIFQILVSGLVSRFSPLRAMSQGMIMASLGIALMFIFQNPIYLIFSILIFSLGEMATSPKIQEYVGKIAPPHKTALYMGYSYLPLAGGNIVAGVISGSIFANIADKPTLLRHDLISKGITLPNISPTYTLNNFYTEASALLHMDSSQITSYLWNTYHPNHIWIVFSSIGFVSFLALWAYDRFLIRRKKSLTK